MKIWKLCNLYVPKSYSTSNKSVEDRRVEVMRGFKNDPVSVIGSTRLFAIPSALVTICTPIFWYCKGKVCRAGSTVLNLPGFMGVG